jgi:hypothetical protein
MEYAVVRRGSYGSRDPTRTGGSDEGEGEEKPERELWGVGYGGLYFFSSGVCAI